MEYLNKQRVAPIMSLKKQIKIQLKIQWLRKNLLQLLTGIKKLRKIV